MQSMTDRRTQDTGQRSEWENCPDITEIFTQDIFRNTKIVHELYMGLHKTYFVFCSPLKIHAMTNRN